jgi:hypothetical protein
MHQEAGEPFSYLILHCWATRLNPLV